MQNSREDDEEDVEEREEENDLERAWNDLMKWMREEEDKKKKPVNPNQCNIKIQP